MKADQCGQPQSLQCRHNHGSREIRGAYMQACMCACTHTAMVITAILHIQMTITRDSVIGNSPFLSGKIDPEAQTATTGINRCARNIPRLKALSF